MSVRVSRPFNLHTATLLALLGAWLLMLFADWFLPWFVVPDMVLLTWIALIFALESVPLWLPLACISLMLDVSAGVNFGFHGVVYGLCAVMLLPGMRHMRLSSGVEQLVTIFGISIVAALVKGVLLYVVAGIPMPLGWVLAVGVQMLLWPFIRAIAEWVMRPYVPREDG